MMIYKDVNPNDPLAELKQQANDLHTEQLDQAKQWRIKHPQEWQKWFNDIKQQNRQSVIDGAQKGWWEVDQDGNMLAPTIVVDSKQLPENAVMAHVMKQAGIFDSVGEARRNGWNEPLTRGIITVTKRKIRIEVI